MRKSFLFMALSVLMVSLCVAGCSKDDESEGGRTGVATMDVTDITSVSATFHGRISLPKQIGNDFQFGFELSESESFDGVSTKRYDVESFSGNDLTFFYAAEHCLQPNHTYYVRAFMQNLKCLYHGNVKSFSTKSICPDKCHPHVINLGLPSGTKWACCNVGASTPEGYGGYYAWGETSEKDYYGLETYAYYNDSTGIIDIGTDISGTQYDVAHVKMGGLWRMPTVEQIEELVDCCTRQWTQQNGVNGSLVTGPSGGQIFLPAASVLCRDSLGYEGGDGLYWSGSLFPNSRGYGAYSLCFDSGYWSWYSDRRDLGQSVRAVCP